VYRDDQVRAKSRHALGAARNSGPQPRHVTLEQLEQLGAGGLSPLPIATRHDERRARAGVL